MSEKLTRIRLRHSKNIGLMDWGEQTFEEMVRQIRDMAQHDLEKAQAILEAEDSDFNVDIVLGPRVQHHVREVAPADKAGASQ